LGCSQLLIGLPWRIGNYPKLNHTLLEHDINRFFVNSESLASRLLRIDKDPGDPCATRPRRALFALQEFNPIFKAFPM